MSELRDDREVAASIEIHTPTWAPGGKLAISYKRSWDHRGNAFVADVAMAADTDTDGLFDRIGTGDSFGDVFTQAAAQALESGDVNRRNTLARLVAAALHEDSRIDSVSFVLSKMESLTPVHIRAFWLGCKLLQDDAIITMDKYVRLVRAERFILDIALHELRGSDFIHHKLSGTPVHVAFELGQVGRLAQELIGEIDGSLTQPAWVAP